MLKPRLVPSPQLLRHFARLERQASSTSRLCHRDRHTPARSFSSHGSLSSGHNKWSTIKHDKAKNDASKNRARTIVAREIATAVRRNGSADPKSNNMLATAISNAKKAGMTKATIDSAIARGQGRSVSGAALDNVTIEAMIGGVSVIVDCETDSKARALQELRGIVKENGGVEGQTAYMFSRRGRVVFREKDGVGADEVLEKALDAGALDVGEDEQGRVVMDTEPSSLKEAEKTVSEGLSLDVAESDTVWHANEETRMTGDEELTLAVDKLVDALEDYQGVLGVYTNLQA